MKNRCVTGSRGRAGLVLALGVLLGAPAVQAAGTGPRSQPDWPLPVNDATAYGKLLFDRLEYAQGGDEDALVWDAQLWYGGDYDRLWLETEGEHVVSRPAEAASLSDRLADGVADRFSEGLTGRLSPPLSEPLAAGLVDRAVARVRGEEPPGKPDLLYDRVGDRLSEGLADRLSPALPGRLAERLGERLSERLIDRVRGGGEEEPDGEVENLDLLYGHRFAPYWDVQAGLGYQGTYGGSDDAERFYAVVGLQGLAPYWFEVDADLRVSEDGDVWADLEAEYDWRLSQRLVLQPRLETSIAAHKVEEFGVGQGLNSVKLGLRLRYHINREVAPYLGVTWMHKLGETADLAEAEGEDIEDTAIVAGVRMWF